MSHGDEQNLARPEKPRLRITGVVRVADRLRREMAQPIRAELQQLARSSLASRAFTYFMGLRLPSVLDGTRSVRPYARLLRPAFMFAHRGCILWGRGTAIEPDYRRVIREDDTDKGRL